jgi:hypothetical protein
VKLHEIERLTLSLFSSLINQKGMLIPKVFRSSKQNVLKNNELIKSKNKKGGVLPPEFNA